MATTTKSDLIDRIALEHNLKRHEVRRIVHEFLALMMQELAAGNRLEFRDFGIFEIAERAPRVAANPKTMERIEIPRRKTVKFKLARLMRSVIDGDADLTAYDFDVDGELQEKRAGV